MVSLPLDHQESSSVGFHIVHILDEDHGGFQFSPKFIHLFLVIIIARELWQPTPVFLPRESLQQRSRAGYIPYGHKEVNMAEAT